MARSAKNSPVQSHHAANSDPGALMNRLRDNRGNYAAPPGDPTGRRVPRFEEWTAPDYHSTHNRLVDAQREFAGLPARVRSRFNNDAYHLIRFIDDPQNRPEALIMGLVTPTDEEALAMHRAARKGGLIEQQDLVAEIEAERAKQARIKAAEADSGGGAS